MKIETKHPEYLNMVLEWEMCRDCFLGERAIKNKRESYLPRLNEQPEESYRLYLERAVYYTVMSNTIYGRLGQIMRKSPQIENGEELSDWLEEVTLTGRSLISLISQVIEELLKCGRVGILVDYQNQQPYFSLYFAEDIPNWRVDENNKLQEVFLQEEQFKETNTGSIEKEIHIRRYYIDEEQMVRMELNRISPDKRILGEAVPLANGRPLSEIPFVFINPNSIDESVEKPPMLDVAMLSLAIYRNSADLEQILHTLAVPTPYGIGMEDDEIEGEFVVGPNEFKSFRNPDAKLGMLEFSGAGVNALRQAIEDKMGHIASIGGTVVYNFSKIVEQAETARLRMASETAALAALVNNAERGINRILTIASNWAGWSDKVQVRISRDFANDLMSPDMMRAINEAESMGMLSEEAAFDLRQRMEIYPDGWSLEKEKELRDKMVLPEKIAPSIAGSISQALNPKLNNPRNQVQAQEG